MFLHPQERPRAENRMEIQRGTSAAFIEVRNTYTQSQKANIHQAVLFDVNIETLEMIKLLSRRIKAVADFGVVSLDIASVDSKDSGTYTCKLSSP